MPTSLDNIISDISSRKGTYWFFWVVASIPVIIGSSLFIYGIYDIHHELMVGGVSVILGYLPIYVLWKRVKKSEEQLQKIRINTRAMLNSEHNLIIQHNVEGHILGANHATAKRLGYNDEELLSLSFWDIEEKGILKRRKDFQLQLSEGEGISYQAEFRTRTGDYIPVEINTRVADWLSSPQLVTVARDISEWLQTENDLEASRKSLERARNRLETRVHQRARELKRQIHSRERAEKDVNELREFLFAMIDSMPSVIIALDKSNHITQWNHQAEMLVGISAEKATGKRLGELIPELEPHIRQIADKLMIEQYPYSQRLEIDISGKSYVLDLVIYTLNTAVTEGVVVRVDDVTEQVKIENMLVQTEKMLSLGGLAAGMAHEINNPLGAILQSSQNLRRRLGTKLPRSRKIATKLKLDFEIFEQYMEQQNILGFLNTIDEAGKRAAVIVEDMLSFARPAGAEEQDLDLEEIIESSVRLAQNDFSSKKKYDFRNIKISKEYSNNIPHVVGRRSRLQQVFLNLLTNAAQALADTTILDPKIELKLYKKYHYVVVEVQDNGKGMSERIRRRIFEPFFTTKSESSGTGLGLSVSYFIVTEQMNGEMEVDSHVGVGTKFTLCFPISKDSLRYNKPHSAVKNSEEGEQFELPLSK